jgi:DNA repair protein RadC
MLTSPKGISPYGPRERLREVGAEGLSDTELLALVLGTGSVRDPVAILAARLIENAGGIAGLDQQGLGALAEHPGIGVCKAARILAALELGKRLCMRRVSRSSPLTSSQQVDAAMRPKLARLCTEQFIALALDSKYRLVSELRLAAGGLNCCAISPADVFRAVIKEAAAAIIVVHNHPSGDPQPSPEDILFSTRLHQAGELLTITVLDHVIIGAEGYFSFLDQGLLPLTPQSAHA